MGVDMLHQGVDMLHHGNCQKCVFGKQIVGCAGAWCVATANKKATLRTCMLTELRQVALISPGYSPN